MAKSPAAGIEGFTHLANNVSIYRPQDSTTKPSTSSPKLVVLCSWMGAVSKNIAKYTAGYQNAYPHTSILLVESSMADTWASDAKQHDRLKVASDIIATYRNDSGTEGIILLHAMSNGGGIAAIRIATLLNNNTTFDKTIFDCLPGRPNADQTVRAISMGLPKNWLVRFVGRLLIRMYYHIGMYIVAWRKKEDMLNKLRRELNDPALFSKEADRLYLYSKKDQLVGYDDVADHAAEAKALGFKRVKELVFDHAPHCALILADKRVYWGAVQEFPLEIDEEVVENR